MAHTDFISSFSPEEEVGRIDALRHYQILDTPAEAAFDDLVRLASQICGTPIALISLIDETRQWFKASVGTDLKETPRVVSVCRHTIQSPETLIFQDLSKEDLTKDNPLVTEEPHLRFYAGAPLTTPSGYRIGTICVIDTKPRELTEDQKSALQILSSQVVTLLELRVALAEKDETARRLAETTAKATRTAEQISLALNSGAVLGTWVWDIQNDLVTGDERFARTFNISLDKLALGISLNDAFVSIHPNDADGVRSEIKKALVQGGKFRAQYRVSEKDRGWIWVEANGVVELGDHGGPVRFPGVLIDIDDKKRLELAAQASGQRYEILFNSIDEGFCIIDVIFDDDGKAIDYIFVETNPAFESQTGLKNTIGKSVSQIAPDLEQYWFDLYGTVAKTRVPVRVTNYAAQLNRWFEVYAFHFPSEKNHVAILFSDVTQKIKTDKSLRESEARLSLMVESAQDYGIISTDEDGIITSWNSGAENIFGYLAQQAIGQPFSLIFTKEDKILKVPEIEMSVAREQGRARDERWHERANGERFYASGITAAMRNDENQVTGYLKIAQDMTRQRHDNDLLLQARNAAEAANIAKTEFLANMSHEIRTPMNAIVGLSHILMMSKPLTEKQSQYIDTLKMSADSMLALINDLLDISKIEARSVELEEIPFSLSQVIEETANMLSLKVREKNLGFTIDFACVDGRTFMGDPARLRQVMLNLLSNAIKFTEAGSIQVLVTSTPDAKEGHETICISVKDSGIGIDAGNIGTIFQKFMQADTSINRKYGGTGLGLTITKTILEIMGGTISVESIVGEGSVFTACVPLRVVEDGFAKSLSSVSDVGISAAAAKPLILLVEDYEPNVIVASTLLEAYGYEVDIARNGAEAVEKVNGTRYGVVLMDVQMHGMNGLEATERIRDDEKQAHRPRASIIGMTAHALAGDRERCLKAGMDDYISKPFNPEELRHMIDLYLSRPKAA